MKNSIPDGVWPTMLTSFTEDGKVDYRGIANMIQWYLGKGVDGLFAVCQSSEMFYLTKEERKKVACFVVKEAEGVVPVIASGHVSNLLNEQIDEIKEIADTGVETVVLVSNRLAACDDSDEVWMENAGKILEAVKEVTFGIYECPYPYKRSMSLDLLDWCVSTNRFSFLKDTCCDIGMIKLKIEQVKGSRLKVFNANSATLLESLQLGAAGFSGVMANFHPDLYIWLTRNWMNNTEMAVELQYFLSLASMCEYQLYPVNAKYHMQLEGVKTGLDTKCKKKSDFTTSMRREIGHLKLLTDIYRKDYK